MPAPVGLRAGESFGVSRVVQNSTRDCISRKAAGWRGWGGGGGGSEERQIHLSRNLAKAHKYSLFVPPARSHVFLSLGRIALPHGLLFPLGLFHLSVCLDQI